MTLFSAGAPAAAGVGTYDIVPSAAVGTGLSNYSITYNKGTLTVATKLLTITADDASKVAGDTLAFTGTEFTASGLINADTVTSVTLFSAGADSTAAAGSYNIVPSAAVGTGLSNYTITYNNGALTVNPAPVPPTPTAPFTFPDQLRYKLPYLEQFAPHQLNPIDFITSSDLFGPVYFYHPLTESDSSAFAALEVSSDAYEFINGTLNLIGHDGLLPILEDAKKKKKGI